MEEPQTQMQPLLAAAAAQKNSTTNPTDPKDQVAAIQEVQQVDSSPPSAKKGKKKKKKKKLTAKQKALEKLEKASTKFIDNPEKFNEFLTTVAYWLKDREKICYKLLNQQALLSPVEPKGAAVVADDDDEESKESLAQSSEPLKGTELRISYDDFKLVLRDIDIPCNKVELHVLCKLLDQNPTTGNSVDFRGLTVDVLKMLINREFQDGIRLIKSAKPVEEKSKYPVFSFKLWEPLLEQNCPKYLKLDLKLATFANDKEYKGHIKEEIICSHTTVYVLIQLIKKKTDIASCHVSLFKDPTRTKSVRLDEHKTLEECGYKGGPFEYPKEYVIFYDYSVTFRDDPVINSDFYFAHNKPTVKK